MPTPCAASARVAARLTAISAGWAFSVRVRASIGPSKMIGGELLAEGVVDLVEYRARLRKGLGERLPHPDRLAALAGECECDGHSAARRLPASRSRAFWLACRRPVKSARRRSCADQARASGDTGVRVATTFGLACASCSRVVRPLCISEACFVARGGAAIVGRFADVSPEFVVHWGGMIFRMEPHLR